MPSASVQLFTLQTPYFNTRNDVAVILKVGAGERPGKPDACEGVGFSEKLWEVMQCGWTRDPAQRPLLSAFNACGEDEPV
jgi:hypothetical protein